jgi:hypothetical protein
MILLWKTKFDKYRKMRNDANYYGKALEPSITTEARKEIIKMIQKIKERHLKD